MIPSFHLKPLKNGWIFKRFRKKFHLTTNETESRNYPLGKATSHLLGYVGPINSEELKQKEYKGYKDDAVIGKRDSKTLR